MLKALSLWTDRKITLRKLYKSNHIADKATGNFSARLRCSTVSIDNPNFLSFILQHSLLFPIEPGCFWLPIRDDQILSCLKTYYSTFPRTCSILNFGTEVYYYWVVNNFGLGIRLKLASKTYVAKRMGFGVRIYFGSFITSLYYWRFTWGIIPIKYYCKMNFKTMNKGFINWQDQLDKRNLFP